MHSVIKISDICNLSRIPIKVFDNPIYRTCKQLELFKNIHHENTEIFLHYQQYKPKTLSDLFGIKKQSSLDEYSATSLFLPWYHSRPVTTLKDVAFINADNSFVFDQIAKLKYLMSSISKNGFVPEDYIDRKEGMITGYFLETNTNKKFYVVSGNHRVSVLACLYGDCNIHVAYEKIEFMKPRDKAHCNFKKYPNFFYEKNIKNWQSVKSGFLNEDIALSILKKYVGK